jgi:AraC-like DNA-binding protein
MLTYLSAGQRRYGDHPIRIYARQFWEFEAVLSGAIAPTFPPGSAERPQPAERSLWIFPPGVEHGWTGIPGAGSEIAVFHFDSINESAAALIRKRGYLRATLAPDRLERVRAAAEALGQIRTGADTLALLKSEAAALELTVMALETLDPAATAPLLDRAELAASGAVAWYSEHMADNPSIAQVARTVNCSESHFRRLFQRARGIPPAQAFEELRADRARELLRRGDSSVKEIAAACGYESQSCFSRAFKRITGRPPREALSNTD